MGVLIDVFGDSINKYGEELCGNRVEIIRKSDGVSAILADGLGIGVKANMLACLAIKMFSSMLDRSEPIEDVIDMIVDSQPAGRESGISYSAFTIIQILGSGMINIAQMDTPAPVFLLHGKPVPIDMSERIIDGKTIKVSQMTIKNTDTITAFSDGVLSAGIGDSLKNGWQRKSIAAYMVNAYKPGISAEKLTRLLLTASNSLYINKPSDDLSVLTFRVNSTKS
jgi:hypothetical protein